MDSLINLASRNSVWINPHTYRHVRYSTKRKRTFTFSGLKIHKDKWCPKNKILVFDSKGSLTIYPVEGL